MLLVVWSRRKNEGKQGINLFAFSSKEEAQFSVKDWEIAEYSRGSPLGRWLFLRLREKTNTKGDKASP